MKQQMVPDTNEQQGLKGANGVVSEVGQRWMEGRYKGGQEEPSRRVQNAAGSAGR